MAKWGINSANLAVMVPDGWPDGVPYNGPALGPTDTGSATPPPTGQGGLTSGLTNGLSANTIAQLIQAANTGAAYDWSDLMGYVMATGQLPPPGALTSASQQAIGLVGQPGSQLPTTTEQNITGYDAKGNPTLAALQQYADLTGLTPTGMPGAPAGSGGTPTLAAQTQQGFVGGLPTTTEQQVASQQIASILAANNPANPFTYLSKLNNINQLGDTSSLLRNAMQQVTGYTTSQLAQQPTIPQSALLSSLYGNVSGGVHPLTATPASTTSNPDLQQFMAYLHQSKPGTQDTAMTADSSGMLGQLMSYLHNSKPTATPTYDSNGNITAWTPLTAGSTGASANPLSAALPNLSNMSNSQNPNGLSPSMLSGWGLSNQQFNKMSNSAQGALLDYIQSVGGANPTDATSAMKQGAPDTNKSPFGTIQSGTI